MSLPKRIAFVGNPNCGKSTLFNRLTGLTQKTSNLPGTTVEASMGHTQIDGQKIELIDLPGIYSLFTHSDDERLVVQHLAGYGEIKPEALLLVIDASNLRRNLLLYSQVAELGIPAVCVLTLSDSAKRRGVKIDADALSNELGIPCIFFNPRREKNIDPVKQLFREFATPKLLGQPTQLADRLKTYWDQGKLPGLSEETLRRYIDIEQDRETEML